jgi:hypothetical protein
MKNKYPEFYNPSDDEFKKLWEEAHFVFDANTLLNLYMYTNDTVDDFWKVFESIKDRIWLSFQAGYEFHKNRPARIRTQQVLFEKTISSINSISKNANEELVQNFKNIREHPTIEELKIINEVSVFFDSLIKNIETKKDNYPDWFKVEDKILMKITNLFNGKVGDKLSKERLEELYKEGEKRYLEEIPPGFEDAKAKKGIEKYGDLIIWKEILDYAKDVTIKSIIFITDDGKKDWWRIASGRTVGPHPHLLKEFSDETKKTYYQYSSAQFLKFAKSNLINIRDESISETKRVAKNIESKHSFKSFLEAYNLNNQKLTSSGISQEILDEASGQKKYKDLEKALLVNNQNLTSRGISQEMLDEASGQKTYKDLERALLVNNQKLTSSGISQEMIDELSGRKRYKDLEEALKVNQGFTGLSSMSEMLKNNESFREDFEDDSKN